MTYRVVFTVRARADVIEQFHYLVDRSPAAAARWYTGIEKAIAKLGTQPERHPIAQDETEQLGITLRQMLYGRRPRRLSHPVFGRGRYRHPALCPPQRTRPHRALTDAGQLILGRSKYRNSR